MTENEPHVHVEDTNSSNSYSLSTGELLQSSRNIDRKTEKWNTIVINTHG